MNPGHGHTIELARTGPRPVPLLWWCLVQLAALCLAAFRVPLAAKYPAPPELHAVPVMAVTQIAAASLLFPYLLGDWRTALAVIATAWPFAAIASALSALPAHRVATTEMYVMAWLIGLALWRAVLRGPRASLYGVAVASAVTVGSASMWYLSLEFGPPDSPVGGSGDSNGSLAPLVTVVRQLAADATSWKDWLLPIGVISSAASALLVRRIGGRDRLSTTPAPAPSRERPITR